MVRRYTCGPPPDSHWLYTMYRCALAAFVAATVCCASAVAQVARPFPATALRGALLVSDPPNVVLNGQPARLGAGARILGQDNLIKMPATLVGAKLAVHYTIDSQGLLREVWILRAEEAAKSPWPTTPTEARSWRFDPVAQVWAKP
jgi:hypothetical protein